MIAINDLMIDARKDLKVISAAQTDSSSQSSQTKTSGLTGGYNQGTLSVGVGKAAVAFRPAAQA